MTLADDTTLTVIILILVLVVASFATLIFLNYRRDDLPSRPTKPYMNDEEWDGK